MAQANLYTAWVHTSAAHLTTLPHSTAQALDVIGCAKCVDLC